MVRLLVRPPMVVDYPDDVKRLVDAARTLDFAVSFDDACWAWKQYSEDSCAGWLTLGGVSDEHLVRVLQIYLVHAPHHITK